MPVMKIISQSQIIKEVFNLHKDPILLISIVLFKSFQFEAKHTEN